MPRNKRSIGGLVVLGALGVGMVAVTAATQLRGTIGTPVAADSTSPLSAKLNLASTSIRAEGRVVTYPGGEIALSAELAGHIARVLVAENQTVRAGDVLAELETTDLDLQEAALRAQLQQLTSQKAFLSRKSDRQRRLVDTGATSLEAFDYSGTELSAARGRLAELRAGIDRIVFLKTKTQILAPIDGTVISRTIDAGEYIVPGQPAFVVADLTRVRVEAEIDEFDAAKIAQSQAVVITAEGHDGKTWTGHIEEVPGAVEQRRIRPQDPARPSDTRVLLPKIAIEHSDGLKLGQRVDIEIVVGPKRP